MYESMSFLQSFFTPAADDRILRLLRHHRNSCRRCVGCRPPCRIGSNARSGRSHCIVPVDYPDTCRSISADRWIDGAEDRWSPLHMLYRSRPSFQGRSTPTPRIVTSLLTNNSNKIANLTFKNSSL